MNKNIYFHIILLLSVILWCNSISGLPDSSTKSVKVTTQDTLKIDTEDISPRNFQDFSDRYNDEDFIYERTTQNSGWWTRFKQWISDFFRDLFNIKNKGQASKATDIAIKIAGVIIFLLVIYFIFKAVINDEGKWVFGKSSDKNVIPVTDVENNIHETDFKSLIHEAETESNYRLAIRYYYLWLLKRLAESNLIEYDVEKTNSDYHNEIVATALKNEFAYTSYLYNYIWYGEFNVDDDQFDKAKSAFINLFKSIKA